jgi:hypothetical protein
MFRPGPARGAGRHALRLTGAVALSAGLSAGIVLTSLSAATRLGVPDWWPWLLTGLQVTALWAAGAKRWWGWLLGASVQAPWIVYAVLTDQLGFIPGCAVSAAVQAYSYLRRAPAAPRGPEPSRPTLGLEGPGKARARWSAGPTYTTSGDRHEPELLPCPC